MVRELNLYLPVVCLDVEGGHHLRHFMFNHSWQLLGRRGDYHSGSYKYVGI